MPRMRKDGLVVQLDNLVREHPDFEVLCEPTSSVCCFRFMPNGLAERQEEPEVRKLLDHLNEAIVEAVQREGLALLMMTRVGGRVAMHMSISPHRTLREDVDATFEAIARWGRLSKSKLSDLYVITPDLEAQLCSSESHSSPTEVSAT